LPAVKNVAADKTGMLFFGKSASLRETKVPSNKHPFPVLRYFETVVHSRYESKTGYPDCIAHLTRYSHGKLFSSTMISLPNRQSLRKRGFDYASAGAYFLTFCTYQNQHLFGEIQHGKMILSDNGSIVEEEWIKSAGIREEISLGVFVIMPNHFHGIVHLHDTGDRPVARAVLQGDRPAGPPKKSIGALMAGFKSAVTFRLNARDCSPGRKIWHRNYWDNIIHTQDDYDRIEAYILSNPANWEKDKFRYL
jgi:REP element-mobilizing transposase RayT